MSRDKQPNDSEESGDQVQDYLDLLLSSATDAPEAQIASPAPPAETSLKVFTGANVRPLNTAKSASKPLNPTAALGPSSSSAVDGVQDKPAASSEPSAKTPETHSPSLAISPSSSAMTQPSRPIRSETKPFAEPNKPLRLNMPLPAVQEVQARAKQHAKPSVEVPVEPSVDVAAKNSEAIVEVSEPLVAKQATPPIEPLVEQQSKSAVQQQQHTDTLTEAHKTSRWLDNGRPEWAQHRFECLLFKVGGLSLAVPLVELGTIYPMTEELTPLFGQAAWFMGLLTVKEHNIRTVNTAKIVMPERYSQQMDKDFTYVLSINGVDWGLAVDSVANAITLDPTDVRWRSERSKRPWLAGTVVDHMCALLDVSQLAKMFLGEDKSQ